MERQKNGTTSCTVTLPKHIKQHKLYQFIFCFYVWFFFQIDIFCCTRQQQRYRLSSRLRVSGFHGFLPRIKTSLVCCQDHPEEGHPKVSEQNRSRAWFVCFFD